MSYVSLSLMSSPRLNMAYLKLCVRAVLKTSPSSSFSSSSSSPRLNMVSLCFFLRLFSFQSGKWTVFLRWGGTYGLQQF